jgi:redox-sensitive bicupin YhaK (pirin superfamily)
MDRKLFIKKSLLGAAGIAASSASFRAKNVKVKNSTYDNMMKRVGFNHLPNKEIRTMKSVLHRSETRGHANHGWLDSHHTFSFANYHHPERMNFGVLRVLNDDVVAPGRGFGTHPHDNMEIISIPLEGDLEHKDSMGNVAIIKKGDVQVMSAGTGVYHSEYNKSATDEVRFLQIWMFPNQKNVTPRYDQITLNPAGATGRLQQILSPNPNDEGVWVHQDAWFHIGNLTNDERITYQLNKADNGIYAFVLDGHVTIEKQSLSKRDGIGIWDTERINIVANGNAKILLMEVPMSLN